MAPYASLSVPVFMGGEGVAQPLIVTPTVPVPVDQVLVGTIRRTTDSARERITRPRSPAEGLVMVLRTCRAALSRVMSPVALERPFLDMRDCDHNNMAHLFVEVLPCYFIARRLLGCEVTCVMRNVTEPYGSILRHFGVPFVSTARRVSGEQVCLTAKRGLWYADFQTHPEIMHLAHLPDIYRGLEPAPLHDQPTKVFLARRDHRALRNQAEIEAFLREFGYSSVYMEDLEPCSQMALAANVQDVVAIHGAAMGLLMLNRRMRSVVEVLPPHVYHNYFPLLLGPKVDSYAVATPQFDESVPLGGWRDIQAYKNRPFAMPLDVLDQAIRHVNG